MVICRVSLRSKLFREIDHDTFAEISLERHPFDRIRAFGENGTARRRGSPLWTPISTAPTLTVAPSAIFHFNAK